MKSTGSRRWYVFKVGLIDIAQVKKIDMKQVWMEAYDKWLNGYEYWIDLNMVRKVNTINEEFHRTTVAEDLIVEKILPPEQVAEHEDNWFTTTEIAKAIYQGNITNAFIKDLGKGLKKRGYIRKSKSSSYKWSVCIKE